MELTSAMHAQKLANSRCNCHLHPDRFISHHGTVNITVTVPHIVERENPRPGRLPATPATDPDPLRPARAPLTSIVLLQIYGFVVFPPCAFDVLTRAPSEPPPPMPLPSLLLPQT